MKNFLQKTKTFLVKHKDLFVAGAIALAVIAAIGLLIAQFVRTSVPELVYQPSTACGLLSKEEAAELFGGKAVTGSVDSPVVSGRTNNATSKCSYTDGNPNQDEMIVAAVIVRSAINDKGIVSNNAEFTAGVPATNVETVKDIGDRAYFDKTRGQLNVLKDRNWIVISYGIGSAPELNSTEDAIKTAEKILN